MPLLTRQIGRKYQKKLLVNPENININKVLICRPNSRLGNLLLVTPIVQEVIDVYPNCEIDLVVKGNMADKIFKNYNNVNTIIKLPRKPFKNLFTYIKIFLSVSFRKYDLVINAEIGSSSGKILTLLANGKYKIFDAPEKIESFPEDFKHLGKTPVYLFRYYFTKTSDTKSKKKIPGLDIKLTEQEIKKGKEVLNQIIDVNRKTIAIFTNATGDKKYSVAWWKERYTELLHKYPDHNIVEILPIENTSQINFTAPTYYSKDIREMAAVIENTDLHISADCGVMHLASATNTPTIGLFSGTAKEKYEPYNTLKSFGFVTNKKNMDTYYDKINLILVSGKEYPVQV
ncbi:glycosyltransferase family 9 protein [Aquimarina latercula]|uniref:glycosyltransferase family 9 protein n=1 Tax=Aquimarina latercula TaxID=987 RepID=UPI00138AF9BE|nr:glycosyltransferase family 9 protein [Aquimarina latercula]